jgi:Fe-S cluster assembly protein SufD
MARAERLGPPTSASEDWRYVNVRALDQPLSPASTCDPTTLARHRAAGLPCAVLIDGHLVERPSDPVPGTLDELSGLGEEARAPLVARWLQAISASSDPSFCWSFADGVGGLSLRLAQRTSLRLHLILVSTGARSACQIAIDVAAQASLDLVISQVDLSAARTSVGIDARIAADGRLRVDQLQYSAASSPEAQVFTHANLALAERATASWVTCLQGGALVRTCLQALLQGAHSEFHLGGLIAVAGKRQAHLLTRVHHLVAETTSTQLVKTIADGHAQASFDGLVRIVAGADLSSARQYHHNLLLSPTARVDTRPQLDIAADDVQAAHGATVGRPNPDELFYLRSRGIPNDDALSLLRRGFAREAVLMLSNAQARALAEAALLGSLTVA